MSNSIRIWYLIGDLAVGGAERTLVDLISDLDREQFTPTIWTITETIPLAEELPGDVPIHSLGAKSKGDVRAPLKFIHDLRQQKPDIVQSFLFFDNTLARVAGLFVPETTVISGVRAVPESMALHRDIIDRLTLQLSDRIVSNSEAGKEWVIERGAYAEQVHVVHNGRDVSAYNVELPDGYRQSLDIPEGPIVGTVGRLIKRKGHHDLLAAWPDVIKHHPNAQLVLAGDGPQQDELAEQIRRLDVKESVHLLGRRDDVPELLALFDVFAFPSYYEGLPGALLEAMCAELPIVTTPVDGCSELVHDGEHGLHVPVADSEALSKEVNRLLANEKLAMKLATSAKSRAECEFSLDAMVNKFESLYK
jgi:glycosyltransferase involved in cell wall biosynthesis